MTSSLKLVGSMGSIIGNIRPNLRREKGKRDAIQSAGGYRDAIVAVDNSRHSIVVGSETKKNPHLIVEQFFKQWISKWQSLRKIFAACAGI